MPCSLKVTILYGVVMNIIRNKELTPLKVVIGMLLVMFIGFSVLSLVFVTAH